MSDSAEHPLPLQIQIFQWKLGNREFAIRSDHFDSLLHADDSPGEVGVGKLPLVLPVQAAPR